MLSAIFVAFGLSVQPTLTPASAGVSMKDRPMQTRVAADIPTADDPFILWDWMNDGTEDAAEASLEDEEEPRRPKRKVYTLPAPGRHPFVFVRGYPQRFYVPAPILNKHQIAPGETIAPELARKIAIELGASYTKEELDQLRKFDEETPK